VVGYLTSRRHLVGSVLALLGLLLAVVDPVGPQGFVLVPVFYVIGAVALPEKRELSRYGFSPNRLQQALADEIGAVSGRVSPEVINRVQHIELTIRTQILPRLDCLPMGSRDLYLVERTAFEDLPTALDVYLRLPEGYVSMGPGSRGRPAIEVLLRQLDVMDAEMRQVAATVQRADMDRLLAHERFLIDRLTQPDPPP
jgi:hypothetical protein